MDTGSFRKARLGKGVEGVALYVREQWEWMDLCPGSDQGSAESLWVKISGQINMTIVVVGICNKAPD